jgi:hypothetical protein
MKCERCGQDISTGIDTLVTAVYDAGGRLVCRPCQQVAGPLSAPTWPIPDLPRTLWERLLED